MIEQVTIEQAVALGTTDWQFCIFRATGNFPVTVSRDADGVYWQQIIGATEPQAVPATARIWALPIVRGAQKP